MSTDVMKERIAESSPLLKARIAGVLYLIITIAAPFAEVFVRGRLVVDGDAAATAANILAHQPLYRLAGAADLIAFTCDAAVALLFYELLKPVSRSLSLFAACFRLLHVAIVAVNTLNHFAALVLLGGEHFLTAFKTDQLQALALLSLSLHGTGYNIGLVFFGFHCMLIGYLISRSAFLPRILGGLIAIAGLCYLTNSVANFLSPSFAAHLFPYILLPGLAEPLLALWLLVRGVNVQRWKQQADAA
ncbi:MAG: DUF4386 domain-containing protein [Terriglobales bacterium]